MRWLALALTCFTAANAAGAEPAGASTPTAARIAIIVDDLGDSLHDGHRVIALPGPVACAILPHTPHARVLASRAREMGKDVMLHLPMEPRGEYEPGPGVVAHDMGPLEVSYTLAYDLESVPHVTGINNHMGSRLTAERSAMTTVMRAIAQRGNLFFVDSMTSTESVAAEMARHEGIPTLTRDVFLDSDPAEAAVERQFDILLRTARQRGQAVGIGHPYPATLAVLERRLPLLAAQGFELVSPSALTRPVRAPLAAEVPTSRVPATR